MTLLTVLSAFAFRVMSEARVNTANDAIREYASLGARLFGDRGFSVFENYRIRVLSSVYGRRITTADALPDFDAFVRDATREMDLLAFAVGDTNRGFFMLERATGRYRGAGAGAAPSMGSRIAELIRTRPKPADVRIEPMPWLMVDAAEPLTVGIATLSASGGDEVAYYGFMYSRRLGWKSVGDAVIRELPLLPGSFVEAGYRFGIDPSRSDTLVSMRLIDAGGRVLYESRPPFAESPAGEFAYSTGSGAFRAVETLHPALVTAMRRSLRASRAASFMEIELNGKVHRITFPFEALLPVVALLLATLAGFGLWRDQRVTRARRDFVASVSHELRTPLAQIRMFTETLQLKRERDEDERAKWLNIIGREARRLGDLVENILLFSHLDADRAKLECERTDLGELIEEIAEGYVPLAQQKGMRLLVDAPSRIFCLVDPRAMRQIIVNLLDNALKYGPHGQTVQVELERIGAQAKITVSDQGPGVKASDRKRVWEPFVRLGDGGTSGGNGIGLAVVRGLVALHDGTIEVDDAPGGGARFTFVLAVSESSVGLPPRATGEFRARAASSQPSAE
jgi:signal transduction histidine kinase